MKTNAENLIAASQYWIKEAEKAERCTTYVVASPNGLRVLASNMAVMLAGCCKPEQFAFKITASIHAKHLANQPVAFDGEPVFVVMTYERFCDLQHDRFETALHTLRVADAMAAELAVA